MLKLPAELLAQIDAHGVASYPYEGCGLLLGHSDDGERTVAGLHPVENVWPDVEERRERFRIAPEAMLQAELAAARQGLDVIGVFHSHPDHEPVASPRDLAWATWPGYSYLITEVREGKARGSRSWELAAQRDSFVEEEVVVIS